ncbi:Hos4p KNAG_0E01880 [Huiozyma naganishii CBS 8797]|uniref:Uncharacterized protein n=1 Tax=Huiozyma naganishii (strain ATCC MYA-139 / BCRC 22969 / CBS 8797 / KCTC 17520 / NBRC 10181 / NCYC 3082 / Yp74L-3) TaxID=1071383 RepID=J7R6H4_HUIN7|nr:hypothetical protein KNAG_0E01880 [Kazachstania naganishii CBS 8797]CCK70450.1 hypothetical protein KNAG_0E01880 [Kazachstania naganishii CBS 8797]
MTEKNPKRRSLSSYLSNVSSRKVELAKLAQGHVQPAAPVDAGGDAGSTDTKSAATEQIGVQADVNKQDPVEEVHKEEATEEVPEEPPKASRDELEAHTESPESAPVGGMAPFSRDDLKSVLHESMPADEPLGELPEGPDPVDSDAETQTASPTKRDKQSVTQGGNVPTLSQLFNGADGSVNSDSELSDINDFSRNSTRNLVSSSFLNEEFPSSPVKQPAKKLRTARRPKEPVNPKTNKKSVYRDSGGRTKLQIACDKGKIAQVRSLLAEGDVDIDDQDNAGNTPLHEAALNGHLDIVKLLVETGANVNIQSFAMFGDTPLIDASANGHLDVVQYLVAHGSDPTITNAKGLTAYEAIEMDDELDDDEKILVRDIKNCLRAASLKWTDGHHHDHDATAEAQHISDESHVELSSTIDFSYTDLRSPQGIQKLLRASKEGQLSYVGQYLENGGEVNFRSFLEAVRFGHEDIASLFLAFGAQINRLGRDGLSPLMVAVGRDHLGTVKLLLEAGADPTKRSRNGHTALYYAKNSILGVVSDDEIRMVEEAMTGRTAAGDVSTEGTNDTPTSTTRGTTATTVTTTLKGSDVEYNGEEVDDDTSGSDEETVDSAGEEAVRELQDSSTSAREEEPLEEQDEAQDEESSHEEEQDEAQDKESSHEEDPVLSVSKRRNSTPTSRKRSVSSTSVGTSAGAAHAPESSPKRAKPREETAEEREHRLKEEEEYLQRRSQNKKRKEQEYLRKLQEEEQKRLEEKARQRTAELERKAELERQQAAALAKKLEGEELDRRRRVRALYPLGLKLVNFHALDDVERYFPVYYVTLDHGERYVLDLQMLVILKRSTLISHANSVPITDLNVKARLWNIYKYIFLFGGHNNDHHYETLFQNSDISSRLTAELQEFHRFANLPMSWVPWDGLLAEDPTLRRTIEENHMVAIDGGNSNTNTAATSAAATTGQPQINRSHQRDTLTTLALPPRLKRRRAAAQCLTTERARCSRPLW